MPIHNCHVHTFTMRHVPHWYYFGLAHLLRPAWIRRPVMALLRNAWPFSSTDQAERLAKFAESGFSRSQGDIFTALAAHYPADSRFVILPMDMAGMDYGAPADDIVTQHEELAALAQASGGRVLPFVHFDPRRPNALDCIRYWIEVRGFKGVKIYPPLGYRPTHAALAPIFAYCAANDVPVMTHCSGATVRARPYFSKDAHAVGLGAPKGYGPVLDAHSGLRLCLAHFGGERAWAAYLRDPGGSGEFQDQPAKSWINDIRQMITAYPGLYVDVSYTMFSSPANLPALAILLQDDGLRARTLFGSDFYMSRMETMTEREHCFCVRHALGEAVFGQIAEINPLAYLGGRICEPVIAAGPGVPASPVPQVPASWSFD